MIRALIVTLVLAMPLSAGAATITITVGSAAVTRILAACSILISRHGAAQDTTNPECVALLVRMTVEDLLQKATERQANGTRFSTINASRVALFADFPTQLRNAVCGDGDLDTLAGEECDDAGSNSDVNVDACRTNCRDAFCGDGVIDTGEVCDDNTTCLPDCSGT